MKHLTRQTIFTGSLAAALFATACKDSVAPVFEGPPPLPLLGSMQAETNFFEVSRTGTGTHYNAAAAMVATAKAITIVSMPTSITVFEGAEDAEPEEESDGYHWIYAVTAGNQIYDADLKGRARGIVDAVWEIRVTSNTTNPALADFVLFSGRSELSEEKGEWKIFDHTVPTTPTALLDVFWYREGNESWRIIFKNIRTGSANIDDYLEFQSAANLRRILYMDKSVNAFPSVVEWNTTTNEGYIKSETYNGDVKSCWNSQFLNVVCQS